MLYAGSRMRCRRVAGGLGGEFLGNVPVDGPDVARDVLAVCDDRGGDAEGRGLSQDRGVGP